MMAFYCYGKMGVCEENRTGCSTCDYLDGSGGKEIPDAPLTHADLIRAMNDEELATQFVQIVKEAIKAIADADLPNNLCDQMWSQFIDKLKQPVKDGESG